MAHNIEFNQAKGTYSFVEANKRELAWHRLGQRFNEDGITASEALTACNADFTIAKQPIVALTPEIVNAMETGLPISVRNVKPLDAGTEVLVYVRPEEFIFTDAEHGMKAEVRVKRFLGKYIHYVVDCGTGAHIEVTADTSSAEKIHQPGETVYLGVNVNRVNLFDKEKETTLLEGVESHV